MSSFAFEPETAPFPRWMGPYSPSRGSKSGIRLSKGRLGGWTRSDGIDAFWEVQENSSIKHLCEVVQRWWNGGRVLFLPTGYVVKPLQEDDEVGQRVLLGRFRGSMVLVNPWGPDLDLSEPGLEPGEPWPGPTTIGLETVLTADGSLECRWSHPAALGRDEVSAKLRADDEELATNFRLCRPADSSGRVRVTSHGHVITNRPERNGSWTCLYVGWIHPRTWSAWDHWIEEEE